MLQSSSADSRRINSIDILRGIVMIIMALDHVRDFFHIHGNTDDPLNLSTTTPALYFTRWVTHFCAPVFVFLSGTSIYLQSLRKSKKDLSTFLVKRGLWLIFAEIVIVTFGITFNPFYNAIILQVIWAIGISMLLLGLLIHFPYRVILALGIIIVLFHNLLDIPEATPGFKGGFWWDLLHSARFAVHPFAKDHFIIIIYPFLPWFGLMLLGYSAGIFFSGSYSMHLRQRLFTAIGIGLLVFFFIVRSVNHYGDPFPWTVQKNSLFNLLSFIKVHKYPPSLLYMCVTIGPAFLALAFFENVQNRFTNVMRIYGRTAFFYYLCHFYLIHIIATVFFFARGHSLRDAFDSMKNLPFMFLVPGEGFGLAIVYVVWLGVVIALYPLCKWYDTYKTNHKEKWWLSYL